MGRRARLYAGVASGLVLSMAALQPVTAQQATTDAGAIELAPVTLSGEQGKVPATKAQTVLTDRITRAQIDAAQVEDPDDISRLDPAVNYSEGSKSFNIRGLDSSRVLTTVDGVRIPWIEDGARGLSGGVSAFDFDTLSQLDVVKGSDSSLFGSGAIGGVIALRTINPEDLLQNGKVFGGISKGSFDTKDNSWGVEQALAARIDQTFFLVQGGYREGEEIENQGDIGTYGITRTEKNPLDFDQNNILAKVRQHVEGGHVFGLTGETFDRDDDIDSRFSTTTTYTPGTARQDEVNKRKRVSASYEYDPGNTDGLIDAAEAVIYWQRQNIETDFNAIRRSAPIGDYRRLTEREEETYGVNGSVLSEVEMGGLTHGFTVGGELFASQASSASTGEDNCAPPPYASPFNPCNFLHSNQSDMPDVDGTTLGLFIQDEIAMLDGTVRITPGLRYDWYQQTPQETPGYTDSVTYAGLPDESSDSAFSPKLRAEWDSSPGVTLFAQWAQGFRAPTANELYLNYGGPGTYLRLGDPELDPETSNGFEIGAKLGDEVFGGSVNGFYNRYKDFIDAVTVTPAEAGVPVGMYPLGLTQSLNRNSVEIYGAEASVYYAPETGFHSWASFASYLGKDRDTGEHLNSIPALKAVLGLGYNWQEFGGDVILTGVAARNKVENELSKTPGYGLVDVTAWWAPEQLQGAKLKAGVYNLFDRTYYDALDIPDSSTVPKEYYTEAGRSFKATLTFQF
jgi:hemoglobin/transferrin/lactoferrin receptor protein